MKDFRCKTYVLMVSKEFMKSHPRSGERTWFPEKIYQATVENPEYFFSGEYKEKVGKPPIPKIHTIRRNYDRWKKKIDEVNAGIACLDIRTWSGKPYRSLQLPIVILMKEDDAPDCGVSVQRIEIQDHRLNADLGKMKNVFCYVDDKSVSFSAIASNDGLSPEDFFCWFAEGPLTKRLDNFDGCIIHFTDFRY